MNWIDFIILFVIILAFLNGYRRGAFKEISTFIGLIVGTLFAVNNADWLVQQLHGKLNFSPTVLYMVAYILVLAASIIILKLLGHYFYKLVKIAPLKVPNRIIGGVFSMVKGAVALSLVFLMFLFPTPFRSIDGAIESSVMARPVRSFVPFIYNHTGVLHPRSGEFMVEVHKGIILPSGESYVVNPDNTTKEGTLLGMTDEDVKTLDKLSQYYSKFNKQ